MKRVILNTIFVVLLVLALVLLTFYYIINSIETEQNEFSGFQEITGNAQQVIFEDEPSDLEYVNVKTTERYDDKFFNYLQNIQNSRDRTFMKGKVFFEEK